MSKRLLAPTLMIILAAQVTSATNSSSDNFPEVKGITLVRESGRWQSFEDQYSTQLDTATGKWSTTLADQSTLSCEFKFASLLHDIQSVLVPEGKSWTQVAFKEVSHRSNLAQGEFAITEIPNAKFDLSSGIKLGSDLTTKTLVPPRCEIGHWNLSDEVCNAELGDSYNTQCQWICDKTVNEATVYKVIRTFISSVASPTSPDQQSPAIQLSCVRSSLSPNNQVISDSAIFDLLHK